MDVLSEIFDTLRLQAALYFRAEIRGPFAVRLPEEHHYVRFHCVLERECFVSVPGEAPVNLERGDLVLVTGGAAQVLSSSIDIGPPLELADLLKTYPPKDGVLRVGDSDVLSSILCGFLRVEETLLHPAFATLPRVMILKAGAPPHSAALSLLFEEATKPNPGASFIMHRIVEILLIQSIRRESAEHRHEQGFIAALSDPKLARSLKAIHDAPHEPWTVATLAKHVGMSRSGFSDLFAARVGMAPFSYLTLWRMTKAREMLKQGCLDMAEIAERCGYSSVPSFTRRFSKMLGIGPGEWRRVNSGVMPNECP